MFLPRMMMALALVAAVVSVAVAARSVAARTQAGTTETPDVLLSRQLVDARQLRVGDVVRLAAGPSGARSGLFRVAGVYEPTPDPMRFAQPSFEARVHLPDLLALTADPSDPGPSDTISAINVALVDPSEAAAFAGDLSATLPGAVATSTGAPNERTGTFLVIERFHLAVAIITMMGSAVFLLALMMLLVDDRRETIGTLRLIGFTRHRILMQIVAEGLVIAAAGTLFGVLFALATEGAFNRFFQWRYDTALVFVRITPGVVAQSMLLALPLGIAVER